MEHHGRTQFFLIDYRRYFHYIDPDYALVDVILDAAKGTALDGTECLELGVCIPTITAAVNARSCLPLKRSG